MRLKVRVLATLVIMGGGLGLLSTPAHAAFNPCYSAEWCQYPLDFCCIPDVCSICAPTVNCDGGSCKAPG